MSNRKIKNVDIKDIGFEWKQSGGWRFDPPRKHPEWGKFTDTTDVVSIILEAAKAQFRNSRYGKKEVGDQLQRLFNIARYNFNETDSDVERTYQKGQMNAFKAVAVSFGLEVI